ncbi:MAG TPA: NAD-dependent epimerase/dehydratase family protein, partial [Terriglobales bacterium]|nr:NAD-dependent epimerase/dehydratase family protein [Terriglobales bacterium]
MARILISGASGLIGTALIAALENRGDQIYRPVRRESRTQREIRWDPMQPVPPELVSGNDVVIHLSGE